MEMPVLGAGELLCETMADVRERVNKGATAVDQGKREFQALKIAAALRLILLDEHPLLVEASAPFRSVKPRFRIRPVRPDDGSDVWFANDLLDPVALSANEGSAEQSAGLQAGGVQQWNRALTPDEIRRLYEQGRRRLNLQQTVDYQTLLRQPVIRYGSTIVTVKDVIRFLAHVGGGVHHGTPESPHEEEIENVCHTFHIQGLPSVHASIFAVARVVARGLEPLETAIRGG